MPKGVQVWVKCSACHKAEFTSKDTCSRCGQVFSKTDYNAKPILPKGFEYDNNESSNIIQKEISCYRCRSLWIGVAIAGLSLLAILNFMYDVFDFGIYQTYDIMRYVSAFGLIGFGSYIVYLLLEAFCKGTDGIDKGSKWALFIGLTIAVGVILLLVVTLIALDISVYFYSNYAEFNWRENEYVDKELVKSRFMATEQCHYIKDLFDTSYSDTLEVEYFGDSITSFGYTVNDGAYEKYSGCWK